MIHHDLMTKAQLVDIAVELKVLPSKNTGRSVGKEKLVSMIKARQEQIGQINEEATPVAPETKKPEPQQFLGMDVGTKGGDQTVSIVGYRDASGNLVIDKVNNFPAPKRFPHGAKSASEVYSINQKKRKRNKRKHKMDLLRRGHGWANGSNQQAIHASR